MSTTKTGYGRMTKQAAHHCKEKSVDEIIKSESVAVRRSDRREIRQSWSSQFQEYTSAMETCGAHDVNSLFLD